MMFRSKWSWSDLCAAQRRWVCPSSDEFGYSAESPSGNFMLSLDLRSARDPLLTVKGTAQPVRQLWRSQAKI